MMHDPSPYVGSARCAGCHAGEFQVQQASRHARTFFGESDLGNLQLPPASVPDPSDAKVAHTLQRRPTAGSGRRRRSTGGCSRPWSSTPSARATAG